MKPPWSNSELKRLGSRLRDEQTVPSSIPEYERVIEWYDQPAVRIQEEVGGALDRQAPGLSFYQLDLSSRAKTVGTLQEKLRREWPLQLPSVQDLAGVRAVGVMSLAKQDRTVQTIVDHFGLPLEAVHDLRDGTHAGYRAVHVWARLEEGRVEIQVRTVLQNQWANTYEALADLAGRQIRYGGTPDWLDGTPDSLKQGFSDTRAADVAGALRLISTESIAQFEAVMNLIEGVMNSGIPAVPPDIRGALDRLTRHLVTHWSSRDDQPSPFDWTSEGGLESAHSALIGVEDSIYETLANMEDLFRDIRRDIEGSGR